MASRGKVLPARCFPACATVDRALAGGEFSKSKYRWNFKEDSKTGADMNELSAI